MNNKTLFLAALCAFSLITPLVQAQSETEKTTEYFSEQTKKHLLFLAGYGVSTAVLYACLLPLHNYFDAQMQESYMPITDFKKLIELQKTSPNDHYGYMFGYAVRAQDVKAFSADYNQLERKHWNTYLIQNIAAVAIGAHLSQWAYNYLYQPHQESAE